MKNICRYILYIHLSVKDPTADGEKEKPSQGIFEKCPLTEGSSGSNRSRNPSWPCSAYWPNSGPWSSLGSEETNGPMKISNVDSRDSIVSRHRSGETGSGCPEGFLRSSVVMEEPARVRNLSAALQRSGLFGRVARQNLLFSELFVEDWTVWPQCQAVLCVNETRNNSSPGQFCLQGQS